MKILVLADYFSPESIGGAGIVSFEWTSALRRRGHEVNVVTTTTDKRKAGESTYDGMKIYALYSDYNQDWRAYVSLYNSQVVGKIRRLVDLIKPGVVQAFNIHTYISYASLKIAKSSSAKVFITMHDAMAVHQSKFNSFIDPKDLSIPKSFDYKISQWDLLKTFKKTYNPFRNIAIRHYLKCADKIFAVSDALKQVLNANKIGNVAVIHNGIEIPRKDFTPGEIFDFKSKHGLIGKKVISFAGWTTAAKGGEQLLAAMKKVAERLPEAFILAVGREDIYYAVMRKSAGEMDIGNKVKFTGWLSGRELRLSYACSDVVAFPSICLDTFGMVNLEGMAARKPVVATCFGGAPEIVSDGVTGYIVNPFDSDTMADKIIDLLSDPEKARNFGEAGFERAKNYFDFNSKIDELLSWYEA